MATDITPLTAAYALLEDAGLATKLNLRLCNLAAAQDKDPREVARRLVESTRAERQG